MLIEGLALLSQLGIPALLKGAAVKAVAVRRLGKVANKQLEQTVHGFLTYEEIGRLTAAEARGDHQTAETIKKKGNERWEDAMHGLSSNDRLAKFRKGVKVIQEGIQEF